jgi:hypothetical protein
MLLVAIQAIGADKHWQDAHLVYIGSEVRGAGAMAIPVGPNGSGLAAVPIRVAFTYYKFQTEDTAYIFFTRNKKPLNLTLHGTARIAYDGKHAYVIDDAGRQQKLDFLSKALKQK